MNGLISLLRMSCCPTFIDEEQLEYSVLTPPRRLWLLDGKAVPEQLRVRMENSWIYAVHDKRVAASEQCMERSYQWSKTRPPLHPSSYLLVRSSVWLVELLPASALRVEESDLFLCPSKKTRKLAKRER